MNIGFFKKFAVSAVAVILLMAPSQALGQIDIGDPLYGSNVKAVVGENGTKLIITGNGRMKDFDNAGAPWKGACASTITNVVIGDGVTHVGKSAFSGCTKVASVTIPNSVTSIGESAFTGSGLVSVTIPNSVTVIENFMFHKCSNLKSVTIPNGVTVIGASAFRGTGLTSITLPASMTHIGDRALGPPIKTINSLNHKPPMFYGGLGDLLWAGRYEGRSTAGGHAYTMEIVREACVSVPDGSVEAYRGAKGWRAFECINDPTSEARQKAAQEQAAIERAAQEAEREAQWERERPEREAREARERAEQEKRDARRRAEESDPDWNVRDGVLLGFKPTSQKSRTDIVIPSEAGGYPITVIGSGAFRAYEASSITIPSSITSIGSNAFFHRMIPQSRVTIGANVQLQQDSFLYPESGDFIRSSNFANHYNKRGKVAGTYTFRTLVGWGGPQR